MRRGILLALIFVQFFAFLCSGSSVSEKEAGRHSKMLYYHVEKRLLLFSTRQMDITTPITTVPTPNPTTSTSTTNPLLNPAVSDPDSPATTPPNPVMNPAAATTPPGSSTASSSGGSWCIASQSASKTALQVALDYACGYGGVDCLAIQPGGSCYNPNTLRDHASYAFNSYYHKYPVPNSCNFGGTAISTNTNPSYGTCQYPSTSTSSSILNTTNSIGAKVFGSGPINPSPSGSGSTGTLPTLRLHIFIITLCCVMLLSRNHQ